MLGGKYEVINAGIPGYTSLQGERFLKSDLLKLEPDIVPIMFAWNDHWAAASGIADKDQVRSSKVDNEITCQIGFGT